MRQHAGSRTVAHGRLSAAVAVWVCWLAGCCCWGVPSARFNGPPPYPAVAPVQTAAASICPLDDACVVPPEGYCGADDCPPLWAWSRGLLQRCCRPLRRCCGPLFHPGRVSGGEAEAELLPPHARFHPVPSAPVFAQRQDYAPPERMMMPLPAHPRLAPHALPHVPDVQPLAPSRDVSAPVPDSDPNPYPTPAPIPVPVPVPVPIEPSAEPTAKPAVEPPAGARLLPQPLPALPRSP